VVVEIRFWSLSGPKVMALPLPFSHRLLAHTQLVGSLLPWIR
jgi:hypothetical protein